MAAAVRINQCNRAFDSLLGKQYELSIPAPRIPIASCARLRIDRPRRDTVSKAVCSETSNGSIKVTMGRWFILAILPLAAWAQAPGDDSTDPPLSPPSTAEKWDFFVHETFTPFTAGAGAFNATISQITRSTPLYGKHPWPTAYPKRFGASVGDIVSQNFFGDFLLASAFHEDTRYVRRGASHGRWERIGYAISRSIVTRTDAGEQTFNYSNVLGTAMSAGLSNVYYPPASRKLSAALTNWGTSVAGSGLANLMPEFLPDVKAWMKHKMHR